MIRIVVEVHAIHSAERPFAGRSAYAARASKAAHATDASDAANATSSTVAGGATHTAVDRAAATADSSVVARARALIACDVRRARQGEQREQRDQARALQGWASLNVSQAFMSPVWYPRLNHFTRCAELPCVNDSGVT